MNMDEGKLVSSLGSLVGLNKVLCGLTGKIALMVPIGCCHIMTQFFVMDILFSIKPLWDDHGYTT